MRSLWKYPQFMQISDGVQNLIDPVLHAGLGEVPIAVLYLLIQVLLHVLKHEVQLVVLLDDLLQLHGVGVVQLAQGLHLSKEMASSQRRTYVSSS